LKSRRPGKRLANNREVKKKSVKLRKGVPQSRGLKNGKGPDHALKTNMSRRWYGITLGITFRDITEAEKGGYYVQGQEEANWKYGRSDYQLKVSLVGWN